MAKKFDYGEGVYYFNITSMGYNCITIHRKNRKEAMQTFENYKNVGKDVEWLGQWDGKKFIDTKE